MVVRFFIDLNDYASRVRSLKEITSIVANIVAQRDDLNNRYYSANNFS